MRRLGVPVGFAFALVAVAACHSAADDCRADLKSFSSLCAATFDGTEANLPACPLGVEAQSIVSCGELNVVLYVSPGGIDCV